MNQCQVYNNSSLNFFRAVCGFLALGAFLLKNEWLVLITALLFIFGVFSIKFNFIYQIHNLVSGKLLRQKFTPIQKETGELKFVYGFTGALFLISFVFLYFEKYINFAWGLDLLVSFLTLLASFANICLASLMYVSYRKIFNK